MGNSAMDIAVESSYVAEETYLAARSGVWIVPKYLFGKPADQLRNDPRVPFKVRQRFINQLLRTYSGPPERYGLPKPDHRFGEAHPTVSGRILDRIQHGTIAPEAQHRALDGGQVRFVDGSAVEADVVVYCTGYKISFPFFDKDLISAPENHIELFRRVFHPEIPNVFFIGLLQPLGGDHAARRGAGGVGGRLPRAATTRCRPARSCGPTSPPTRRAMRERYVASKRHTIQVDFDDYLYALEKERRAGAERARARGYARPILCRTFCRHNRFVDHCPICARERAQTQAVPASAGRSRRSPARPGGARSPGRSGASSREPLRVRREQRALQDGYSCELLPGLGSSQDAERLVGEIAFATGRLKLLASDPPASTGACGTSPARTSSGRPGAAS